MTANLPRPSVDENVSTTLSSGITDVAGTMDVADASKIVEPCYLVIDRVDSAGNLRSTSFWEYVKVTNVASNTLTITRAQGGSTAQAHSAGAVVEAVVTSTMFEDWYTALNPEHTAAGGHVITGTMTVAGMNLASVATISNAGIGVARVVTHLNASGASISGTFPATSTATVFTNSQTSFSVATIGSSYVTVATLSLGSPRDGVANLNAMFGFTNNEAGSSRFLVSKISEGATVLITGPEATTPVSAGLVANYGLSWTGKISAATVNLNLQARNPGNNSVVLLSALTFTGGVYVT